jgi:alkanesulfonate monooxygenase SsuD/methylene tetrahydromethanopterin reductase-like flavin-dependent oxidoreductase (luciferase family)
MFHEALDAIRQAWTKGRVNLEGEHYRFRDVPIRPAPVQVPHPPIWMAALSPETFELAGRYGLNLLYGSVFGLSPDAAAQRRRDYFRGLRLGGHSVEGRRAGCLVMVYVAKSQERARSEFREPVIWYYRTIARYVAPKPGAAAVKSYEMYTAFRVAGLPAPRRGARRTAVLEQGQGGMLVRTTVYATTVTAPASAMRVSLVTSLAPRSRAVATTS